jgi:hypothetical protein
MNDHDADVLDALKESLGDLSMRATADEIVAAGRTRRRRRRLVGLAVGGAAVTGLGFGVGYGSAPSTPAGVHIQTVGYTVDTKADGTVHVTWDKQRLFDDREGLQAALRQAGMPVLIKVGEFCKGPQDSGKLGPHGDGAGVDRVMKDEKGANGRINIVFTPSAVPRGMQLFIGYLSPAQLAVTRGSPGAVARLVPSTGPLTCTTTAPTGRRK